MLTNLYYLLITVVTMFLQRNTKRVGSKTYTSVLVVERFRKNKEVCSRTVANISKFPPQVIAAIDLSLKGGEAIPAIASKGDLSFTSGKNFGGLWVIKKSPSLSPLRKSLVPPKTHCSL